MLPNLSPKQLTSLNSPFTATEITRAISTLPSGKAPGPDGFSAEYYKLLNTTLAPHMCQLFNAVVSSGTFPDEMLSANIVTLPKPRKEPVTPPNFRPISLLNTDLKLYAKLIAQRLAPIMPHLIHPDQVGLTMGWQAPDAAR